MDHRANLVGRWRRYGWAALRANFSAHYRGGFRCDRKSGDLPSLGSNGSELGTFPQLVVYHPGRHQHSHEKVTTGVRVSKMNVCFAPRREPRAVMLR